MYFEDVVPGMRLDLGSFTFTAEEIKRFAVSFDPQPFHVDEAAARNSHFGGLIASGWQVAAVWMKLLIAECDRLVATGADVPRLGPAPGFQEMVWAAPVRAGDTLTYHMMLSGKKESASRPEWGMVAGDNGAVNQHGDAVFRFKSMVFWQRRPRG